MEFDLNLLLRMARRWWWLLLLTPMIGGVIAYANTSRQPAMYAAEATLMVNSGSNAGNDNGSSQSAAGLISSYKIWVLSRPVLERAAEELDLDGAATLEGKLSSSSVPNTLFIQIRASDTDPEAAAIFVNTVADVFVEYVQEQSAIQNSQVKSNIDDQIDDIVRQVDEADQSIRTFQSREAELSPEESEELNLLVANRDQLQQVLEQLQLTSRSIDVELASAQTRITVSSPAIPPQQPYAPTMARPTVLGAFAGLMLGVAALILLEYLDNTVRSREEAEQITGAPVLATIANAPNVQLEGEELFVQEAPNSGPAESMRLLRANLEFVGVPERVKTIVVSSAEQDEGKSTVTANLGAVLAKAGLNTIIIDADLRRPTQHHLFGINNDRGLSTLLANQSQKWDEGIVQLSIPNLTLIPSGPLPPNPADLLSLERFDELIAEIGKTADVILIDTSPILAVSDALVVATRADGALLVCRTNVTPRHALRDAASTFEKGTIQLLGLVINRDKNELREYGRYEQTSEDISVTKRRFYYGGRASSIPVGNQSGRERHTKNVPEPAIAKRTEEGANRRPDTSSTTIVGPASSQLIVSRSKPVLESGNGRYHSEANGTS